MNIGDKINYLTLLKITGTKNGRKYGLFQCDCGNVKEIRIDHVVSGNNKACGCKKNVIKGKGNYIHGISHTRLYKIWTIMKQRCYKSYSTEYQRYGARGIKICDEWKDNPKAFYDWAMENGYDDSLSIDRIDVNGDYCPENCKWSTLEEQANNKRNCVYITRDGRTQTMAQWCREFGIPYGRVRARRGMGWSEDKLFAKKNSRQK